MNVGRRCGWEANQQSSSQFPSVSQPQFISSFPQCFFSPYFPSGPSILLCTINLIVTYNCKTLLSTIFQKKYTKCKGRMNWPEVKPGRKKKSPIIYKAQASNWVRRKTLLGQNCLSQPKNVRRRKTEGSSAPGQEPPPPGGLVKPENIWLVIPELLSALYTGHTWVPSFPNKHTHISPDPAQLSVATYLVPRQLPTFFF